MALSIAIDGNRYTDFARGVPEVVALLERAKAVHVPFVVLGELRAGFRGGTKAKANEAILARFLQLPGVSVLFPDEQTTHVYADLHAQLRRAGTPIPINDLWIAALVVQHGLVLYTRDRHFDLVPQIPRI